MTKTSKVIGVALATSLMIGVSAGAAQAVQSIGACPSGGEWTLSRTSRPGPWSPYDVGNWADGNADTHSCYRVNRGLSKKHGETVYVWKDNTKPLPSIT